MVSVNLTCMLSYFLLIALLASMASLNLPGGTQEAIAIIIDNDKIYFIDFGARLSCNPMMLLYHRNINYASKLIDKILKNIDYKIDIENRYLTRHAKIIQQENYWSE